MEDEEKGTMTADIVIMLHGRGRREGPSHRAIVSEENSHSRNGRNPTRTQTAIGRHLVTTADFDHVTRHKHGRLNLFDDSMTQHFGRMCLKLLQLL